ncbi:MAG: hypothetical protein JXQ73_04685 [Phycisphaerae bacterium]|nr:hypothetical protein [Phycisphaerae bacterium]
MFEPRPMSSLAVASAIFVLTGTAYPAEKCQLRLKFKEGMSNRIVMTIDTDMNMKTSESSLPIPTQSKMTQVMEMVYRVTEVAPDGGVTLEMIYDRVKQAMNMAGMSISYDSREKGQAQEGNPMAAAFAAAMEPLVRLKLIVKLDPKHHVKEVKGFDAYVRKLSRGPGGGMLAGQMGKMFGDKQLAAMLDQFFSKSLPGKPVAVGESWVTDQTLEMPMMGKLSLKTTSTLESISEHRGRRCAKILTDAKMATTPTQPAAQAGSPARLKINSATMKGHYWFDLQAGQTIDMLTDQDMDMSIDLQMPGQATSSPAGIPSMRQLMKSKMRMTVRPEPTTRPK